MDTIDINLKKKKRRKLFSNIAIASALSFAVVGVGVATIYNNDYHITKAIEYDDETYSITLSADELNNYIFSNLGDYITDNQGFDNATCSYLTYSNVSFTSNYDATNQIYYVRAILSGPSSISFNNQGSNQFRVNLDNSVFEYTDSLILVFSSDEYSDVKNAIELDIADNQPPYDNNTFLNDIISLLVGGITSTANGIGVGLSTLVGSVAIQNNAMSSFMSIVLIFGGIALAFALSRWVVNLISSLGQRNR